MASPESNERVDPARLEALARGVEPSRRSAVEVASGQEAAPETLRSRDIELLKRQFFEVASDAVVIAGQSGAIVQLNAQTERLFGYRRDELLNSPIEILVPERMRTRHVEFRRAYFRNPLPRPMGSGVALFGQRKDGTEFPIDIALSPLATEAGLFVASAIRDMTRQRQLEDQLRRRARDLEEADRQKNQFLMMLAHELHNPLAAIAYSAELLRQRDPAPQFLERAAQTVLEETAFMQRLVQDLGELPGISHCEFAVRVAPTNLADIASLAVEITRTLLERHGHSTEVVLPSPPIWANGDAARLVQVVTNLLANAARYTPAGGHIHLSIEAVDSAAVLKVRDDGIGIPKEMLTRIFDPFTRLESARQRYARGMGIGLAFVRRLMEAQGGSVEAFSAGEGHGSEFVLRLPLVQDMLP